MELLTTTNAEAKAMLRILQRGNPMELTEFQTRAMFDIEWKPRMRERILRKLIDRGLVERYISKFGVELLELTMKGMAFLDEIDWYVFDTPDMAEVFEWI